MKRASENGIERARKKALAEVMRHLRFSTLPENWYALGTEVTAAVNFYCGQSWMQSDIHTTDAKRNLQIAREIHLGVKRAWLQGRQSCFSDRREIRRRLIEAYAEGHEAWSAHDEELRAGKYWKGWTWRRQATPAPPSSA